MNNKQIENLMRSAIEYSRPETIKPFCMNVWNQPFFFKIDKAKVLTVSYNPTDDGANKSYKNYVEQYKKDGKLDTNTILDILYNFKTEKTKWRNMYNIIFPHLGFNIDEIAHMDVSFFPYKDPKYYQINETIDDSNKFLLEAIKLLNDQLKIIFVDGKDNKSIIYKIMQDDEWHLIDKTAIAVNKKNKEYELSIYKRNSTYLIYYGCFLYGATYPSKEQAIKIADHIKEVIQ